MTELDLDAIERHARAAEGHTEWVVDVLVLVAEVRRLRGELDAWQSGKRRVTGSLPRMPHREVVKTWYRSLKPDGSLWCESSSPQEVLEQSDSDCTFQKLEIIQVTGRWKPWHPNKKGTGDLEVPDDDR